MTKSIHQADECWWCGKISWITRAEKGGGSLWNYFFYSLLLGDNINWGGGPQFCGSRVSFDEGHFIQKWHAMGKSRTYPKEIASYHTRWYLLTYTYLYFHLRGSVQLEWILEMSKQAKISQFQATLWTEMLAPIDGAVGHDIGIYVIDAICSLILRRQFKLTQHISASCQLYENKIFVKIQLTTC